MAPLRVGGVIAMIYRITTTLNDGLAEAPPFECNDANLVPTIVSEMDDLDVGGKLTIEAIHREQDEPLDARRRRREGNVRRRRPRNVPDQE